MLLGRPLLGVCLWLVSGLVLFLVWGKVVQCLGLESWGLLLLCLCLKRPWAVVPRPRGSLSWSLKQQRGKILQFCVKALTFPSRHWYGLFTLTGVQIPLAPKQCALVSSHAKKTAPWPPSASGRPAQGCASQVGGCCFFLLYFLTTCLCSPPLNSERMRNGSTLPGNEVCNICK